jgi:putative NADH-flavin reductase
MRILLMASGGWIAASILVRAPQRGHFNTSIKRILLRSSAQE